MRLERVDIESEGAMLSALRYLPERAARDTALLYAHGFTAGKYSMDSMASYLAGKGYEGLTFDFVGHKLGGSGGRMLHADQAVANVRDGLSWLREHSEKRQVVLIGHSMGGVASLVAAVRERKTPQTQDRVRLGGVVCLCVGIEPSRGFESAIGRAMLAQRSDYVQGAPALQLLTELDDLVQEADRLPDLPALFIAARQDVLVSPERVAALAERVNPSARVEILDTSHLEAPDRSRFAIAKWLEEQTTAPNHQVSD